MKKIVLKYLEEIGDAVKDLKAEHLKRFHDELLIGYRGEPNDYGKTSLMPSLFRDTSYLPKEKYLFELMHDYGIGNSINSVVDEAIDAQHYLSLSRMLDISFSAAISLYFACSESEKNNDGYVFVFGFPEHYSPHSDYVEKFYQSIFDVDKYNPYSRNFKVFTHSYSNDRIKAQSGGFVFFPGNEFHCINNVYYRKIKIDKDEKKEILKELDVLFQINDAKVFPEIDKIAKAVKEKFLSSNYITRHLSIENEVKNSLDRIEYETLLMPNTNIKEKNKILRNLRKERFDLIYFVKEYFAYAEEKGNVVEIREEILELVDSTLRELKMKVEGCV